MLADAESVDVHSLHPLQQVLALTLPDPWVGEVGVIAVVESGGQLIKVKTRLELEKRAS